jgi:hypothetical protein
MAQYYTSMSPGRRDPLLRPYRPTRIRPGWLLGVLALALVGGQLLYWLITKALHVGGVPYGLTDALLLATAVCWRVTHAVHGPPVPLPLPPVAPTTEFPDRPFVAARRWEDRLAWTRDDTTSFNRTIRPLVVGVVAERLRQHHGISLEAGPPERIRALLGDPLWTFVTRPVDRPPKPRELAALVDRLEEL